MATELTGLSLLRKPFDKSQISKLPKPTKQQTDEVRENLKAGIRCTECGGWHHPNVVHLDYVGHAVLTNRLLECDPEWNWEPLAVNEKGLPQYDEIKGLWIKLTVCGVTRIGYGDAQGKSGGDAIKEMIGDALRNAATRFGAALDLWSKADLHAEDEVKTEKRQGKRVETPVLDERIEKIVQYYTKLIEEYDPAFCNEWRSLVREDQEVLWKCLTSSQKKSASSILETERKNNLTKEI